MANTRLRATFTRPADVTAYTQGDVITNSTSAGVALNMGYAEWVNRIQVKKSSNGALGAGVIGVLLFDQNPGTLNDNAAFAPAYPASGLIGSVALATAFGAVGGTTFFASDQLIATPYPVSGGQLWAVLYFAGTGVALGNAEQFEVNIFTSDE